MGAARRRSFDAELALGWSTAAPQRMTLADELLAVNERLPLSNLRDQESLERVVGERRQLNALLEALQDGVVITDGGGRIAMLNDAARRILDLPWTSTSHWRVRRRSTIAAWTWAVSRHTSIRWPVLGAARRSPTSRSFSCAQSTRCAA